VTVVMCQLVYQRNEIKISKSSKSKWKKKKRKTSKIKSLSYFIIFID